MRISYVIQILFFLSVHFSAHAQYNYSSNTAHVSIVEAIHLNNNIIKERTANFEKKAASKPLMFVNVKQKIGELNRISNNISVYVDSIQQEVGSERVLYELIEDDFYERIMFNSAGDLSERGEKLKIKIDSLYLITKKINIHNLTHLSNFGDEHFNTKEVYYDIDEKKIDYFEHFFYDTSNYGIMMSLNYLLLDVKMFQLMYYRTVMSY